MFFLLLGQNFAEEALQIVLFLRTERVRHVRIRFKLDIFEAELSELLDALLAPVEPRFDEDVSSNRHAEEAGNVKSDELDHRVRRSVTMEDWQFDCVVGGHLLASTAFSSLNLLQARPSVQGVRLTDLILSAIPSHPERAAIPASLRSLVNPVRYAMQAPDDGEEKCKKSVKAFICERIGLAHYLD